MKRLFSTMSLIGLLILAGSAWVVLTPKTELLAGNGLSEVDAKAARAVIRPQPDEDLFEQIPWQTSLWEARKVAAKEGKPIFLWEMDGHPLGCG